MALPSRTSHASPAPSPLSSRLLLRDTLNRDAQQPFCYASVHVLGTAERLGSVPLMRYITVLAIWCQWPDTPWWLVGRHRARCLTVRLPMPPVRPVRETFASYGSRQRDIMGKVHFASSTVHSPWTALRVRWVPLYCFPTLSLRAFAMYVAFLRSDYYALFDCLEGFGVSLGSRLPTLHPPSHPFQALPCSQHRTQSRTL